MTLLRRLQEQCAETADIFHTERCHYPRPLETLKALFGAENCVFSRYEGIDMVRLLPSNIVYSCTTRRGDWETAMARVALDALPLRRIGEMMRRRVLDRDPALCANPFAFWVAPRRNKRPHDAIATDDDERRDMIAELAERLACDKNEINIDNTRVYVRGAFYYRCRIHVRGRRFQPYVYCETPATAERQALLNALCCA
jgi:hypothetical protein